MPRTPQSFHAAWPGPLRVPLVSSVPQYWFALRRAHRWRYNSDVSRVLMVSSEAAPYAKTGGLADVVGAVPAALQELGDEVAVVLPRYASIDLKAARRVWENLRIHLGLGGFDVTIYQAAAPYPVYLIDCPLLFDRKALYGEGGHDYPDNHVRFALFSKAALAVARHLFRPDIFHCHDWQAGLV